MLFVGIDIAKNNHDMAVIDSKGNILLKHLNFANSKEGFDKLHTKLMELASLHDSDISIALEDTGIYGLNLLSFLRNYFINIYSYNPLLIKKFAETLTLRKTKTDKKDALLIARKLLADYHTLEKPVVAESLMTELKFATRHRNRLTRKISDAKSQYTRLLDIMFPELAKITNTSNQFVYTILKKYPSTQAISRTKSHTLPSIKYLSSSTALKIKEAAKHSIGTTSKALELELLQTIQTIEHYQKQLDDTDSFIHQLMIEIDSPILTVTGIGERLGSVILAEIRDINNFESPAQLQAFAGLEPSVNQSGESEGTGKMVKRGSTDLRWALMQAARLSSIYSPKLRTYFLKKLKEGKHYNSALTHVAKKLIRIIFYMLKNNREFNEDLLI